MKKYLLVGAALIAGVVTIATAVDADANIVAALALLWVIGLLWLTEIFHITITALLVPVLAVALGLLDMKAAMANFAHPIVFLFLGGFALAIAMHVQGLDRWLAEKILHFTKGRLDYGILLLAASTALLSMWISNTATTAVMLPLVLGLLSEKEQLSKKTQAFCLLAIAYSANIGGMGTMIGTAPNALVAAELGMTFTDWLRIGMPLVALLWPIMLFTLYKVMRPDFLDNIVAINPTPFEWTLPRKLLIIIFALTVTGWILGQPLSKWLGIESNMDTWVALIAIALLTITRVVNWQTIEKSSEWGVLLLFGGGLTLSAVLKVSGASTFLGLNLAEFMQGWGLIFIVLALVAFVVFLTEVTSNTATTALLVPVFVSLPAGIIDSSQAALAIGLSASCAFMLPVATPPNALVHGTGKVTQQTMIRAGIVINVVCIMVLTLVFSQFSLK